jgi:hypothetical protein
MKMMTRMLLPAVVLACAVTVLPPPASAAPAPPLAVGDTLPTLEGNFLTGRDAVLPAAAHGRVALLALGFTYGSRDAVEAWVGRYRRAFAADSAAVTFYEIPMIGGLGRLGKPFINRGMRGATPVALHENVITVYGGTGPWKERLGFEDQRRDEAYLVLIDRAGVARWIHGGPFDEAAFRELEGVVRGLK